MKDLKKILPTKSGPVEEVVGHTQIVDWAQGSEQGRIIGDP